MLYHYRCHFLTSSLRCTYTRVYGANISVLSVRGRRGTTVHVEFRPYFRLAAAVPAAGFTKSDGMDDPVTDIIFVSSQENCPEGYTLVS